MLRKIIWAVLALILLIAVWAVWQFMASNTNFTARSKYLYIKSDKARYSDLLQTLKDSAYINNPGSFDWLAKRMDLPEKVKPGRYEIKKGMSILNLVRMLRNGTQSPVNLVITKLRTKEDFAAFIGRRFECDSMAMISYLNNPDSTRSLGLDTSTILTTVFPNTYQLFWNNTASGIFRKLAAEKDKFWTKERLQLAEEKKLTPVTAYILASIIEEETTLNREKDTMASVYLNRYYKGMRLQADPTVKFALRDFALRRIYEKHLAVESPYNTYRNTGLPPGPICIPSLPSLEAVLHAANTNYIYFVVRPDLSGHLFSETYEQHLKYRRDYQESLDRRQKEKAAKEDTGS